MNRRSMKYLSVCSGVEAASQAWCHLGWTPVAFAEIETFPSAVLAARFPTVPNLGDLTKIHHNWATINAKDGEAPKRKTREAVRKWLESISNPDTCPDGPRYKAIGNSMSVNVMLWIGMRIDIQDRRMRG